MITSGWMFEDRENAIAAATLACSSYDRVFNVAQVDPLVADPFNAIPLRAVDPKTTYTREWNVDPVSRALYDCRAEGVDPAEF